MSIQKIQHIHKDVNKTKGAWVLKGKDQQKPI
jgi:hypothetical protein